MREVGPSLRQPSRLAYLDAWKGWAIIAVVIIHLSVTALQFPRGSINYEFGLITRQFLTFAVPFFFSVSGYFSGRHSFTSFSDALPFWRSRFLRLVPPYIVWTGIYLIALSPRDVLGFGIIKDLLFGTGIGVGYFIIVLLQFVILTPFIVSISSKRCQLPLMFGITGAALLLNYIIRVGYSNSAQFPYYVILFPIWYLFLH